MGRVEYGPYHRWFAWRPVDTLWHGWKWLCFVQRRRQFTSSDCEGSSLRWEYIVADGCCDEEES